MAPDVGRLCEPAARSGPRSKTCPSGGLWLAVLPEAEIPENTAYKFDKISLSGAGITQWQSATLPRLKSRVRIPFPAPNFLLISLDLWLMKGRFTPGVRWYGLAILFLRSLGGEGGEDGDGDV